MLKFKSSSSCKKLWLFILPVFVCCCVSALVRNEGECCLLEFVCYFLILISSGAVIYIIYSLFKDYMAENNNPSEVDKAYRCPLFITIVSTSLVVLAILAGIAAGLTRWNPNSVNEEAITNFYTAFIALCTTFVVGFQIYNSIDLNKKMDKLDVAKRDAEKQLENLKTKLEELDSEKNALQNQIEKMVQLNKKCEYFNAYSIGTIRYNEAEMNEKDDPEATKRYCWNAIRAYFNALKLAASGGQNYEEAWNSFGKNKIVKCLDKLIEIHNRHDYCMDAGDSTSIMPIYKHRVKFIKDTTSYAKDARELIVNSRIIADFLKDEYCDLASKWNTFIKSYYPETLLPIEENE